MDIKDFIKNNEMLLWGENDDLFPWSEEFKWEIEETKQLFDFVINKLNGVSKVREMDLSIIYGVFLTSISGYVELGDIDHEKLEYEFRVWFMKSTKPA